MQNHSYFLLKALEQAYKGLGLCSPNPAVGAVVVSQNRIVGMGYHRGPGTDHAEVVALRHAGPKARGATLYVTLEPCCHHGRTPPCTDAIIRAGIRLVVYGEHDPHRHTSMRGEDVLRQASVPCERQHEAVLHRFYQPYFYNLKTQRPWVIYKLAMSFNGKIAGPNCQTLPITGEELRVFTHEQRLQSDALLTSSKTVIHDNPRMNVRLDVGVIAKRVYLIDRNLSVSLNAEIFKTAKAPLTIFHHAAVDTPQYRALEKRGVRLIAFVTLDDIFGVIARDGVHRVWVEAGAELFALLHAARLINEIYFYIARQLFDRHCLDAFAQDDVFPKHIEYERYGSDVLLHAYL
jgi:diaminohydroxyphosphoribosylaminopyrimidine deaminase/5-amino-6-(5-phosphoribosylamino)uracil reductase